LRHFPHTISSFFSSIFGTTGRGSAFFWDGEKMLLSPAQKMAVIATMLKKTTTTVHILSISMP
jgi:hypothetical protein